MVSIRVKKYFVLLAVAIACLLLYYITGASRTCRQVEVVYTYNATLKKITGGSRVSFMDTENPYESKKEWLIFQKALATYKELHKIKLAEIKNSPDGGNVRTLTWACEHKKSSGIGDQMLRTQFFLLLAIMSNRLFLIHWDDLLLKSAQQQLLPGEIDWSYYDESKGMCSLSTKCAHKEVYDRPPLWHLGWDWTTAEYRDFGDTLFSSTQHITVSCRNPAVPMRIPMLDPGLKILQGFMKISAHQILTAKENETVHYRSRELLYSLLDFVGANKIIELPKVEKNEVRVNEAWVFFSHYILTYLFHFSGNLLKTIETYQKKIGLHEQDYLALHLRTGFQGTSQQEKFFDRYYMFYRWKVFPQVHDWDHFIKHAIHMRDELLGADKCIYLSADTHLVKDYVRTYYNDKNFVWQNRKAKHSMVNPEGCEVRLSGESILSIWMDYFFLANAKIMVHSYSSFALSASLLKPIPHRFHSWVMYNNALGCLASHRSGNVTCIDT